MRHTLAMVMMFALHGAAWAGPVAATEADATPAAALPSLTADAAGSAPSGSALAVEIIKDAEAGAVAAELPRAARRDAPRAAAAPAPAPSPRSPAGTNDDPWGVRGMGKTAVQWLKDAVPWLRSDDDERDAGRAAKLDEADWSGSPLQGERGARPGAAPLPATTAATDPLTAVGYGDATTRPKYADAEPNIVRVLLDAIREVLEHPMTWLVVALFVIGGIVVKRIDRRPTK